MVFQEVYKFILVLYMLIFWKYPVTHLELEEDIANLPMSHPLLSLRYHVHTDKQYRKDRRLIGQRQRLASLKKLAREMLIALDKIGLPAFLTNGSLMGYFRHEGEWLPWEDDFDIAWDSETCEKLFPGDKLREQFVKHIDESKFVVAGYFKCKAPIDRLGKGGLAGRVIDKSNGYYVDVHEYKSVLDTTPITKVGNHKELPGQPWLMRSGLDFESGPIFCPRNALHPLRKTALEGVPVYVPANTPLWLTCQFGSLDVPLWWQGFAAYIHTSAFTLILGSLVAFRSNNPGFQITCLAAVVVFGAGTRVACLLVAALTFFVGIAIKAKRLANPECFIAGSFVLSILADLLLAPRALPPAFAVKWRPEDLPFAI